MSWLFGQRDREDSDEDRGYASDSSDGSAAGPANPQPVFYDQRVAEFRNEANGPHRFNNAVLPGLRHRLRHPNVPVPAHQNPNDHPSLLDLPNYPGPPLPAAPDLPGPPPYEPPPDDPPGNPPPYPGGAPAEGAQGGGALGGGGRRRRGRQNVDIDELARQADREAGFVKNFFDLYRSRFTFEGKLGHGMTGVVCQVKQRRSIFRGLSSRRFVVKRAIYRVQEHYLNNEILNLKDFYGAQHIVQPFTIYNAYRNPLRRLSGPTLWMELIENGNLLEFVQRANGRQLPNRLLSRFFLCLIQFCIAMAWPPRGPREGPVHRETIPESEAIRNNKHQLRHSDLILKNILIGSVDANDDIHATIPILKLVDFHRARIYDRVDQRNLGVNWNIFDIGLVMRSLVTGDTVMHPHAGEAVVPDPQGFRRIQSFGADITPQAYPNLDPDLRVLIIQCIPDHMNNLPTLEDLYTRVNQIVQTRSSEYYSNYATGPLETDRMLRNIVRSLIFDADV
ncbi:hypothetical protein F4810DRAFT_708283 [Camillea tinctor]|nr:hypothetical protein F4810DRAFT_708283 [Camillea tinctor]